MSVVDWVKAIEGYGTVLEDRAEVFRCGPGLVVVVADGAGGRGGGAQAADTVIRMVGEAAAVGTGHDPELWCQLLCEIDGVLADDPAAGETTAVVAAVSPDGITGASVGDSGAWFITHEGYDELTAGQQRKPLLGDGTAIPVPFAAEQCDGTLLLASDGLLKYTSDERICEAARESDIRGAAQHLVDLVRLPSGGLPDDVAVILCRPSSQQPT